MSGVRARTPGVRGDGAAEQRRGGRSGKGEDDAQPVGVALRSDGRRLVAGDGVADRELELLGDRRLDEHGGSRLGALQPLAETLARNEAKIIAEFAAVQGKPADIGGYYMPNAQKCETVMRPSATLNAVLAQAGTTVAAA